MMLMSELCDEVSLDRGPGGTTVRLARRLRRPVTLATPDAHVLPATPQRAQALIVDVDEAAANAAVTGPVDGSTVQQLRAALLHAARGGLRELCVDLNGVTVLSSVGVQLLHELTATVPNLTIAAGPGLARQVLLLSGLGDHLVDNANRAAASGTARAMKAAEHMTRDPRPAEQLRDTSDRTPRA